MKFKTLEEWNDWLAICELKARYCRLLDAKDWQAWRGLFSDDFKSDTTDSIGGRCIEGADKFVAFVRGQLDKPFRLTAHQVHSPEIELTSETTANGIWALEDVVRSSFFINLHGRGHYTETYEKLNGQWLIKSSTLTRLREDLFNGLISFCLGRG
ncbi:nuclear transport factor 2 family protein [Halioxenophilus sp. WMMB6]|uniref:nuclear transport factor 2 family protein n=1 Tax=Halioxenophilus sp. WMMB6 TaxID=3073815 RepID=UPI00295E4BCE|nr:nuclear transport factor 2 family protein [Halioxenophilus sp. WMMB6]